MDGDIVMHADKINADHIPVKGLLHVFGEDLADLIKKGTDAGWREGEDIIPMPEAMMPPPHIHGRVTRVAIEGSKIVQYTDSGLHFAALRPPQAHRGGTLRFGTLTMRGADLEIVGDRPSVRLLLEAVRPPVSCGYSKSMASGGMIARWQITPGGRLFTTKFTTAKVSRRTGMQAEDVEVNTMPHLHKWNRGYVGSGELI